jgi:hypothetical protein
MALPKPKSIFDEAHPVVSTGATYAFPDGFRNVLGIAFRGSKRGKHTVMLRGALKCLESVEELEAMEDDESQVVDDENDSIINKVAHFSRELKNWLKNNATFVEGKDGVLYAYADTKSLSELGAPRYKEVLNMESGSFEVTGGIEQLPTDLGRPLMQGDPLSYYHLDLRVNNRKCVPVVMGRNWH